LLAGLPVLSVCPPISIFEPIGARLIASADRRMTSRLSAGISSLPGAKLMTPKFIAWTTHVGGNRSRADRAERRQRFVVGGAHGVNDRVAERTNGGLCAEDASHFVRERLPIG
jgi:hypothetical protein